ncbi:hypothetical protein V8E51_014570 [Hyaloscypha variabilis]
MTNIKEKILANSINLKVLIKALITLIVIQFHGLITTSYSRTSPNRHLLFTVYAHFTSYNNKNAIITNNALLNNVLCRAWDALEWRIRCIRHIINLIIQAFLFTNGHNIIVYIRGSPLYIAVFKKNPFSRTTLYTKGDSLSINATLFIIDVLIKHLQETNYYITTNVSLFYAAALVLNPERYMREEASLVIIIALYITTIQPLTSNKYIDYNIEESYSPTINILLILLISDELERDRGRLEAETIEIRECLKY